MKLLAVDYAGADQDDTCWIVEGLWPGLAVAKRLLISFLELERVTITIMQGEPAHKLEQLPISVHNVSPPFPTIFRGEPILRM